MVLKHVGPTIPTSPLPTCSATPCHNPASHGTTQHLQTRLQSCSTHCPLQRNTMLPSASQGKTHLHSSMIP